MLFIIGYSASLYLAFQACKKTETVDGGAANSTYISAADCTGSTPTYNQDSGYDKMPNNGIKLPAADIKSITCWAKNGFAQ